MPDGQITEYVVLQMVVDGMLPRRGIVKVGGLRLRLQSALRGDRRFDGFPTHLPLLPEDPTFICLCKKSSDHARMLDC